MDTAETAETAGPAALPRPFDAAFFADPCPVYARLRAAGSVHRIALPDGSPVRLVTHEADVRTALTDPRLSVNKAHSGSGYKGFALPPALDANLLNIDPADHLRLRRLVSKGFTPRRVADLRGRVQAAADRLAGALATRIAAAGSADLVTEFANPLPLTVIGDLLGAPLARMEITIALMTLLRRLPGLALAVPAGELRWRTSFRSRALTGLPVTAPGRRGR
ncbi:hypothetical protein [Streptomyces abikoensis]